MLAWIDVETTGLFPKENTILEIAGILTDDKLQETARFQHVVHWPNAQQLVHLHEHSPEDAFLHAAEDLRLDPVVVKMHVKSGLWKESAASQQTLATIDEQLAELLESPPGSQKSQLAGSSIWFDRAFLEPYLPCTAMAFHHRHVDVSTLNELAQRFWPQLQQRKPVQRELHRALPDIEDSLALGRFYATEIAQLTGGGGIFHAAPT